MAAEEKKQANLREQYTANLIKKANVHKECAWLGAVALQNMLSLAENFISKVLARLDHKVLGISKLKWETETISLASSLAKSIASRKYLLK